MGLYFDLKTNELGEITRRKSRAAIQGHNGNMKKGVHFTEPFAATPQQEISSILGCFAILFNVAREAWDVKKAYCCADIPPDQRIALKYPDGFRRFDPITGDELCMLLLKKLYGDPAACKRWCDFRDAKILNTFKNEKWSAKRLRMDPTLFLINNKETKQWMLVSMHSDDFDGVGTNQDILQQFEDTVNTLWTLKIADVNFTLGWQRLPEYNADGKLLVYGLARFCEICISRANTLQ